MCAVLWRTHVRTRTRDACVRPLSPLLCVLITLEGDPQGGDNAFCQRMFPPSIFHRPSILPFHSYPHTFYSIWVSCHTHSPVQPPRFSLFRGRRRDRDDCFPRYSYYYSRSLQSDMLRIQFPVVARHGSAIDANLDIAMPHLSYLHMTRIPRAVSPATAKLLWLPHGRDCEL